MKPRAVFVCGLAGLLTLSGCSSSSSTTPSGAATSGTSVSASAQPSSGVSSSTARSPLPAQSSYVSLGDSYTAGPFIYQTTAPLDCARSTNNYPQLIARAWNLKLRDVSCSGDTTANVLSAGARPAQLDAVSADTALVTVSVGGNDGGIFANLVAGCISQSSNCAAAGATDRSALMSTITARVREILSKVHSRAPRAKVFLIGYPTIVGDSAACLQPSGGTGQFDASTVVRVATNAVTQLNGALSKAAQGTSAQFIDITDVTKEHSICSEDPWINGPDLSDDGAPVHPRAAYMRAVATYVMQQVAS